MLWLTLGNRTRLFMHLLTGIPVGWGGLVTKGGLVTSHHLYNRGPLTLTISIRQNISVHWSSLLRWNYKYEVIHKITDDDVYSNSWKWCFFFVTPHQKGGMSRDEAVVHSQPIDRKLAAISTTNSRKSRWTLTILVRLQSKITLSFHAGVKVATLHITSWVVISGIERTLQLFNSLLG